MVIAEPAIAAEQRLENLFAIDRIFQGQSDFGIVIRRLVDFHRHDGMPAAWRTDYFHPRRLGEQSRGLVVDPVHNVDLTGDQRIETLGTVVDYGYFRRVDMTAAFLPIIGGLFERDLDPGIEPVEDKGAGADGL